MYSGTYIAANTTKTTCAHRNISWQWPTFVISSLANVGLSVAKDSVFTRVFGTSSVPRRVPIVSYGVYTARDCLSVFAAFNLPPLLAAELQQEGLSESYSKGTY